jgi:hypothetical protein
MKKKGTDLNCSVLWIRICMILLSRIQIRTKNANPDPGAWKLINLVSYFSKMFLFLRMYVFLLITYLSYICKKSTFCDL